ncbi:MAG: spore coat associated protein CotJA [Oscillospiraceae bacterium]|nr:spore coat associated protein CotJA [Oscillospiraceae bacterium]
MYPEQTPPACGDACGTLPECAPLAVPYVPFQQTGSKRYSQQDALNNGTLFPGLNLPFHLKPDAANVVNGPLAELQALEFVLVELGLYLDTHQGDGEAFELYKQYAAMEKTAREKYESMFGPLYQSSTANAKTWSAWLNEPWPWNYQEGEAR